MDADLVRCPDARRHVPADVDYTTLQDRYDVYTFLRRAAITQEQTRPFFLRLRF
jgi:hypothetical protein